MLTIDRYETISFTNLPQELQSESCPFCWEKFDENSKIKVHKACIPIDEECLRVWAKTYPNRSLSCLTCFKPIDRSSAITNEDMEEEREYKRIEIEKAVSMVQEGFSLNQAYRRLQQVLTKNEREQVAILLKKAHSDQIGAATEEWTIKGSIAVASIIATFPQEASMNFMATIISVFVVGAFSMYLTDLIFHGAKNHHKKRIVLATLTAPLAVSYLAEVPILHILAKVGPALPISMLLKKLHNTALLPSNSYTMRFVSAISLGAGLFTALYTHILLCCAYDKNGGLFFQSPPSAICRIEL